ncbi:MULTISPECIES: hypothetical protein [unclassified Streptomyces]|uniref:hypothetical protein n=1 Tax=unclassified Streptomyces TaxID=2593676 RepID=UPI0019040D00|nr:hypothetical protein [Streptomyces sp. HSG2]
MIAETVCSALAAAGLGIAAVTAYRRRFRAATRIAAYALIPLGLVMTGVVDWLAGTAFSPVAWAGFAVLGVSWLLFVTLRRSERRSETSGASGRTRAGARGDTVAPGSSAPAVTPGDRGRAAPDTGASGDDDFGDIEAILKKHGI